MGYQLNRTEGCLIRTREIKLPRTDVVVKAEVRVHNLSSGETTAVWYNTNGDEWKIFLAGDVAKRFME